MLKLQLVVLIYVVLLRADLSVAVVVVLHENVVHDFLVKSVVSRVSHFGVVLF